MQRSSANKAKISAEMLFDFQVLAYTLSSTADFANTSFSPCLSMLEEKNSSRISLFVEIGQSKDGIRAALVGLYDGI
jgi:hypothetical protein